MTENGIEEYLSTMYHALRAPRRRQVVSLLTEGDSAAMSARSLAKKIAAEECAVPPECATGEPYRNVYNALSQTHLPTLADAEIIIYDPKRQKVSQGVNFDLAALLLDTNTPTVNVFISLISETKDTDEN